jgi:hypothetical protein
MERADAVAARDPMDPHNPSHHAGHELTDMSSKVLRNLAIFIVACAIVLHLGLAAGFFYLKHKLTRHNPQNASAELVTQREPPPEPHLQHNPPADFQDYHTAQQHTLDTYGWVDRKTGVARIPIRRAMEILSHE